MRNSALQERRNRQILADIVRAYIETGEPVSSRAISKGFEETLSTATIRNVMADLEDAGFLYQPHTSAGRVPTAAAYRFFAQEIASQATITAVDKEWIRREMVTPTSAADIMNRHYSGWTLETIREDLLQKLANERERYEGLVQSALTLCDPAVFGDDLARQVHVEGTAQMVGAVDFASQAEL